MITTSENYRMHASLTILLLLLQLTTVSAFTGEIPGAGNGLPQPTSETNDIDILEACSSRIPHPPILIEGDSAFDFPGNGVVSGGGTQNDPFIIVGWCIVGHGAPVGTGGMCTGSLPVEDTCVYFPLMAGIRFLDTTAHVVVRDNVLVPPQRTITDQLFELGYGPPPSQYGITLRGVQNATLENNLIAHNQWDGIYLFESDHNSIANNTITMSRTGINLRSSNHNAVDGNLVYNMSSNGIFVFGGLEFGATGPSDHNTITDNTVRTTRGDGITLFTSKYNVVYNNSVSDAHGYSNSDTTPCPYERCRKGISLKEEADHNAITNNLVTDNGKGIGVTRSYDNIFEDNIIRNSGTYGIYTPNESERNQFHNNTLMGNWLRGLWISPFRDNVVENNTITQNGGVGIEFFTGGTGGLILRNNNIHDNGWLPYSREGEFLQSSGVTFLPGTKDPQNRKIDISGNWWGDASGPSGDLVDACTGDSLSGEGAMIRSYDQTPPVCLSPWLHAPNQET